MVVLPFIDSIGMSACGAMIAVVLYVCLDSVVVVSVVVSVS